MKQDVPYSGFSASPLDYECPDGQLAYSLGLINEDGGLKAFLSPDNLLSVHPGHEILIIHTVANQKNLIILSGQRDGAFYLHWIKLDSSFDSTEDAARILSPLPFNKFLSIAIVGNTLALATSSGLFYILWKDTDYKYLGNKPPFIPIRFGPYLAGTLNDSSTTAYPDVPDWTYAHYASSNGSGSNRRGSWQPEDAAFWENVSNGALGLLLKNINKSVLKEGYLYQPFFIRYAYRLYDGSYTLHSAPILMLANPLRPIIYIDCAKNVSDDALSITCTLDVPFFGIAHQILGDIDGLKDWSDIVRGVDIFITSPIYTFKQDESIILPTGLIYYLEGSRFLGSTDFRGRDNYSSTAGSDSSSKFFIGHYANSIDGSYTDHFKTISSDDPKRSVCDLPNNDSFSDRIQTESLFYKIASLDIDNIAAMNKMERLPLIKTDLANIHTLPRLDDDYNSHALLAPGALHSYNQRLLLTDITVSPPPPFPMIAYAGAADSSSPLSHSASDVIRVFTRVNGTPCVSQYSTPAGADNNAHLARFPYSDSFPRYIFHPDNLAYKMEISTADGKFYSLPLKQHPFLNGAFWFGGLGEKPNNIFNDKDNTTVTSVPVPNKVYISEINQPFVFPASNIVSIGVGHIYMLSSAAKALSQGQFGQFPLYAFTDQGIWALEVSSKGIISARQPITRDVVLTDDNGRVNSITQIDSAVLFATSRGIMLISGSQTQCISDSLYSDFPFDVRYPPGFIKLHGLIHDHPDSCLPIVPFSHFLKDCRMIYDYTHQRIIVFNRYFSYAYVFSLKSRLWGLLHSDIAYNVNSYPDAFAVTSDGQLVNFSSDSGPAHPALFLTRPLKLGDGNIHKTVDNIIQRGNFARGHVSTVLYGSRDLINWHLVWSSKDHYLRGFHGTPYKYFRIAGVANLDANENIIGASVQFSPRLTNQPR